MPSSSTATRCSRAQAQQRQRQADVVVEVALRRQVVLRLPGAQDGRDHLRHRGLAVAAGDGDQRQLELRAPGRAPARPSAALLSSTSTPGKPGGQPAAAARWRRRRPCACASARKSLASKRSPGARRTGRRPAACACRCARARRRRRRRRPARPPGSRPAPAASVNIGHARRPPRRSAACACARSENGMLHAARLPASPRGPCRPAAPRPAARRRRSSRRWRARGRPAPATLSGCDRPSRIWLMMASGFSLRGLSLVTTTRSAFFSATAAISGRLVGSRSPPQPNTHHSWPPRCCGQRPQRLQRLVQRVGRVGVVDRHQRLARLRCRRSMRPGTAAGRRRRRTASASGTPSARIAPSTPSRLDTLYWPISGVASSCRSPPSTTVKRRPSLRRSRCPRACRRAACAAGHGPHVEAAVLQRRPSARALGVVDVDHGGAQAGPAEQLAPWPAQ